MQDFNFDKLVDIRVVGALSIGNSRRYDLVLLRTQQNEFAESKELNSLDDLVIDMKTNILSSTDLDENKKSFRKHWRFVNNRLEPAEN